MTLRAGHAVAVAAGIDERLLRLEANVAGGLRDGTVDGADHRIDLIDLNELARLLDGDAGVVLIVFDDHTNLTAQHAAVRVARVDGHLHAAHLVLGGVGVDAGQLFGDAEGEHVRSGAALGNEGGEADDGAGRPPQPMF